MFETNQKNWDVDESELHSQKWQLALFKACTCSVPFRTRIA